MNKIQSTLYGRKTYLVALIAIVLNFCVYMNWITVDQLNTINIILASLGLAALRAGVGKV
jgi:hypothetical protein